MAEPYYQVAPPNKFQAEFQCCNWSDDQRRGLIEGNPSSQKFALFQLDKNRSKGTTCVYACAGEGCKNGEPDGYTVKINKNPFKSGCMDSFDINDLNYQFGPFADSPKDVQYFACGIRPDERRPGRVMDRF